MTDDTITRRVETPAKPATRSAETASEPPGHRILITHADTPLGRRLTHALIQDESIESIFAIGTATLPLSFDVLLRDTPNRLTYRTAYLSELAPSPRTPRERRPSPSADDRARGPGADQPPALAEWIADSEIDSVVHLPSHAATGRHPRVDFARPLDRSDLGEAGEPSPASESISRPKPNCDAARVEDAEDILRFCLTHPSVRQLVTAGSAYVYRLIPGNSNRIDETCELDLSPRAKVLRSWIESDILFQAEVYGKRLRVSLLRIPTVISADRQLFFSPFLTEDHEFLAPAVGFDPLCPLLSDNDFVQALVLAVAADRPGVYNIAGREAVPLSSLANWTSAGERRLPDRLLQLAGQLAQRWNADRLSSGSGDEYLRYGLSLDTGLARRELHFSPMNHISGAAPGQASNAALESEATPESVQRAPGRRLRARPADAAPESSRRRVGTQAEPSRHR